MNEWKVTYARYFREETETFTTREDAMRFIDEQSDLGTLFPLSLTAPDGTVVAERFDLSHLAREETWGGS
jgi:hypothetical protein